MTGQMNTLSSLAGRPRSDQAEACRAYLAAAHARIAEEHAQGAPGDQTARAYASAADDVVRALFAAARAAASGEEPFECSLVAVGGYGRAELCPYSDLDLWFLVPQARISDGRAQKLAEAVLYPLWDLRMEVGHAVRTIDATLELARDDLTCATALLDARFLDGERGPFEKLERAAPRVFERDLNGFVRRVAAEKAERHARFGDTVYLLEPNLKNGEGGYRDLLIGYWAAKARFRVHDFADLTRVGQASPRQVQSLVEARRFYLQVRTSMHLQARRKADRLTFEVQEAIAPVLCPEPMREPRELDGGKVEPAVAPQVEALMQRYFLHAKAVKRETERLIERCLVEAQRKPLVRAIDQSFALFNGKLTTQDPEVFRTRPSELVRIFNVALELGAEIYGHTRDLIAEAVARDEIRARLLDDRHAAAELTKLLLDDRDNRSPSMLEQVHDLGLLAALMPEFEPCTGRVQHDLYHVFTVDQHSLYAVGRLKAIARGEHDAELPMAAQAIREVKRRAPLYLGTLLHDVGKPLGKGHSETGARLAVTIATRLGFSEEDVSQTQFLVAKHLLLSHLSQRRDLNDVAMIANLADELRDDETLRELYLLTLADMSMVAPGNLTEWKEQLLRELYERTLTHFRRGNDLSSPDQAQLVARRRARVAELLGESEASLERWFASVPDRYVTQTAPREIARHVALTRRRKGPVVVEVVHRARKSVSEVTICAEDAHGLLSKIAGVLLANRVDVLDAQITSRVPAAEGEGAAPPAEALDVFTTRDRYGRPITDAGRWKRVEEDLARVLAGELAVEELIEDRRERSSLPERVLPQVRTEIEVDNDVSADFSVIDVYTQDRLGVLYTITRTLARLRLDIHLSKVATEAARVADVFYVRELDGKKLSELRVDEIKLALGEALGALQAGKS
ncbi:MAG TPA: [protein-PII] uridylyltransferase [Polyangia bacterium]|nr:[protein-PII] uridylyltransferase [Polyangia bacterium]